jgi:hypothetical protein
MFADEEGGIVSFTCGESFLCSFFSASLRFKFSPGTSQLVSASDPASFLMLPS